MRRDIYNKQSKGERVQRNESRTPGLSFPRRRESFVNTGSPIKAFGEERRIDWCLKMFRMSCIFICTALLFLSTIAFAREYDGLGPISVREQNPVYLQTLSLTPKRASVLPEGTIEMRIDSAYSNLFEEGSTATANLDMDMELWRLTPQVSYGLTDDLEIGIEVPLMHFNGGFLDAFIQKFHKFFGFPNGGRNLVPNNRFSYLFQAGGATLFNYPSADMGLGDISLRIKHQLTGEDDDWPAIAWFADIKFPTGKQSRGFGNGSPDFGLGAAIEASWKRLHGYFNAAYYITGGNDMYAGFMNDKMFAYMVAGELTILPTWSLIVELNGSTPLLAHSGLDAWDGVPLNLIVGFKGEEQKLLGGQDFIWQVGFSEDVTSKGPSVDFTVFISLGVRFDLFGRSRPAGDWLAKR